MMFEIYAVEQNLGSLLTTVRFRVTEVVGEITRVADDCKVTIEGRYEIDDPDILAIVEVKYKEAMGV